MSDWKRCGVAAIGLVLLWSAVPALAAQPTIDTTAQHAVVLDYDTDTILLNKAGDDRIEPASMSKMMTAYVVFEYLAKGQAKMDDLLPVSEEAWPSTRPTN